MGLDMYLYAERNVSGYSFQPEQEQEQYREVINAVHADFASTESPSADITITVGYWRKVNAIHSWFVRNVQEGEDNCNKYWVSREQLAKLRDLCVEVVKNKDKAHELLPTAEGFFFGGTEYDNYYYESIKETASRLTILLNTTPVSWEFYYQSSW